MKSLSQTPKEIYSCAVVGYGYWGPNIARVLSQHSGFQLTCICDLSPKRLERAHVRHPLVPRLSRFEDVLNDGSIHAVAIATPVSTHYELTRLALEHEKHVLVEKPLALSTKQAEDLVQRAKRNKRVLAVGHTFVYSPPVQKIKSILKQRTLGRLFYIDSSRVNLGLFQPDVDVFWDLGPHEISLALCWLGTDPIAVYATGQSFIRKSVAEVGYFTLEFRNGVIFHGTLSWLSPVKLRRTTIIGSRQMIVYDDSARDERLKIYDSGVVKNPESYGEFQLTYRSGSVVSPNLEATEPLELECDDWYQSIRSGREPRSGGAMGVRIVRILEAIDASLRSNGRRIRL